MKKIQFPNLNGLRFFAAFGVVIHHIEQAKLLNGLPNLWQFPCINDLGSLCVSLFFVLSGFLITFLLIEEAKIFQTIDIVKFYIRRSLRIWPLYFIICILGFLVLPAIPAYTVSNCGPVWDNLFWPKLGLYLSFSPHVAAAIFPGIAYAGVLWSVGVEEWFYLLWPWIIKYMRGRELLVLTLVILVVSSAKSLVPISAGKLGLFLYYIRFNCIAVGSMFALLLHNRDSAFVRALLSTLYRRDLQLVTYMFLAFALLKGWNFGPMGAPLGELIYSLIFGFIVLNLASNRHSILVLENPLMRWLGDISYGLYCYNWIAIMSSLLLLKFCFPNLRPQTLSFAIVPVAIALTIFVAALSYEFIERRFLLLKERFLTQSPSKEFNDGARVESSLKPVVQNVSESVKA